MAYTPTTVWANGDVLESADVQGSWTRCACYISQVPSNAVETSKWIDTKHFVRGEYDPVTNQARHVTGLFAGRNVPNNADFTYVSVYNTQRAGVNVWGVPARDEPHPGGASPRHGPHQLVDEREVPNNSSAGVLGLTDIRLYVGDKDNRVGSTSRHRGGADGDGLLREAEAAGARGLLRRDFTTGTYSVGLVGTTPRRRPTGFAWGVSVEAFSC